MIRKIPLPLQLIGVIAGVFLFGSFIPDQIIRGIFTFSIIFKEILSLFLPLIVFSFVFAGIVSFKKSAPLVLAILLSLIIISNGFVAMITFGITKLTLPFIVENTDAIQINTLKTLTPLFPFKIPFGIGSEKALFAAIILGIIFSFVSLPRAEKALLQLKELVKQFLATIIIPLLPFYVLGFLLKIQYEGTFVQLFQHFGKAILIIIGMQITYLSFFYWLASGFSMRKAIEAMKNAFPSYLTGFSTMSSTLAIPVTLEGAEKNIGKTPLSELAIPIMANVHLLGDSISTPLLALTTLQIYFGAIPSLITYMTFMAYFSITMLAASGIPGGAIIVMLPLLKSIFGFTPEMISIIMTLYLLQDPLGTAANVMGDGALVIIVHKILKKLGIHKA